MYDTNKHIASTNIETYTSVFAKNPKVRRSRVMSCAQKIASTRVSITFSSRHCNRFIIRSFELFVQLEQWLLHSSPTLIFCSEKMRISQCNTTRISRNSKIHSFHFSNIFEETFPIIAKNLLFYILTRSDEEQNDVILNEGEKKHREDLRILKDNCPRRRSAKYPRVKRRREGSAWPWDQQPLCYRFSFYSQRKKVFHCCLVQTGGVWKSSNTAGSLKKMVFFFFTCLRILLPNWPKTFGLRALETYYLNCGSYFNKI